MANSNLTKAKNTKNDEFYTQFYDIEKEINTYLDYNSDVFRNKTILLPCDDPEWSNFTKYFALNFLRFGIKKLISTSYAPESKKYKMGYEPSMFEKEDSKFDQNKTLLNGKIFILEHDVTGDGKIDVDDLQWEYLCGDGDFRSEEVKKLRDEADIIITNPPFSLFREFMSWIIEGEKQFVVIANMTSIMYKEIFPLIKDGKVWLGGTGFVNDMVFAVPKGTIVKESDKAKAARLGYVGDYTRLGNSCWLTNIEFKRRHVPIPLMSIEDNLKFTKHKDLKGQTSYSHYENYDALEIPYTDSIPGDYDGIMGVPVSFLGKHCPEQFEIVGMCENEDLYHLKTKVYTTQECKDAYMKKFGKKGTYDLNASGVVCKDGRLEKVFQRILIQRKKK